MMLAFLLYNVAEQMLLTILSIDDCQDCGFDDLGRLLVGGLAAAVVVAIAVAAIKLRSNDKKSSRPEYISITGRDENR
jgi:hypothetical protein